MHVFVSGTISRNVGQHYGQVKVQRVVISADIVEPIHGFVTADSTLYTADSTLWTADGYISGASDSLDAVVEVVGAVIDADLAEAAAASDLADAVSDIAADAIEAAGALDALDAVADVAAAVDEPAAALDELDAIAVPAGVVLADVAEAADALDQLDAAVVSVEVPIEVGGGAHYPRRRPTPVYGVGFGILPQLEGEAHGVVGVAGQSAAQVLVSAAAVVAIGQAGHATVVLKGLAVTGKGVVGARGSGNGIIVKFNGSATGRHDDDEAAVLAILLAA